MDHVSRLLKTAFNKIKEVLTLQRSMTAYRVDAEHEVHTDREVLLDWQVFCCRKNTTIWKKTSTIVDQLVTQNGNFIPVWSTHESRRRYTPCILRVASRNWQCFAKRIQSCSRRRRFIIFYADLRQNYKQPFPKSSKANQYILAIIDAFTKYAIIRPVKNTSTWYVPNTLMDTSSIFGSPQQILWKYYSRIQIKFFKNVLSTYFYVHLKKQI